MQLAEPSVKLLWITPRAQKQIEVAGRTCYKSEKRITINSAEGFCRRMRNSGHHAVLEFASAAFKIITDRGVTHEIVRHRLASYAQESTRYCNYSKAQFGEYCTFIKPPGLTKEQERIWYMSCQVSNDHYLALLRTGVKAEIARGVLPNSLKAEINMACNFREWRHFIQLRGSLRAHPQIRPIAYMIWERLVKEAPGVFDDLKPNKE